MEADVIEVVSGPTPVVDDFRPVEAEVVRQLILQAYDDVVPEMIGGETVEAMMASVEPARGAYQRLAEVVKASVVPAPPVVPAGGVGRVFDPALLPAVEKIRRGLASGGGG